MVWYGTYATVKNGATTSGNDDDIRAASSIDGISAFNSINAPDV
jgi:hypothetical protein